MKSQITVLVLRRNGFTRKKILQVAKQRCIDYSSLKYVTRCGKIRLNAAPIKNFFFLPAGSVTPEDQILQVRESSQVSFFNYNYKHSPRSPLLLLRNCIINALLGRARVLPCTNQGSITLANTWSQTGEEESRLAGRS